MVRSPTRQIRATSRGPALAVAIIVVVGALAGCTTHAATPATTPPPITLPATSPVPVTTGPTASTPTTPPASSTIPTTTLPTSSPRDQAEAAVRAAIDRTQQVYLDCLALTPRCDVTVLETADRDPLLSAAKQKLLARNANGYAARNLESARYVVRTIAFPTGTLTAAEAIVCDTDSIVIYAPGKAPGGADLIIDDTTISSTATWHVRLDPDAVWRVYDITDATPRESTDTCL